MKTTANSQPALFVPRVALGVGLCLAGMSLGLGALSESITQQSSSDQEHAAHSSVKPLNAHSPSSIDWPQYGFDPDHTSFNPLETLLSTDTAPLLQVAWQYFFPCSTYASPVVV